MDDNIAKNTDYVKHLESDEYLIFRDLILAKKIERAVISHLEEGKIKTPDRGGSHSTSDVGNDIVARLKWHPWHADLFLLYSIGIQEEHWWKNY